ncbi:NAD(P)-dependent oxidoreductase [Calidithermus chliarophilus]|uniref:NAD(P)-dependent oxidoreductase n=1 Tax=Calidithermus chliarophilus TaxID=52023 RepID=UPI00048146E3|nr:SDR family oxidoreductase [Calidithermus chliarophilus]
MKITVLGATGRTGKQLVEQALAAGHEVRAFVRNPAKLGLSHPRLELIQGELDDVGALERAVAGQDAVLSALGPVRGGRKDLMELAARNVTAAMKKAGVRRLITLTGAGVAQPGDEPKAFNRLMSFLLGVFAKDVQLDSTRHAEIVRASGLDWTIVRVPVLTDGPKTGKYRVGMVGINSGSRISRADVAHFMLEQLGSKEHVGRSPMVSY